MTITIIFLYLITITAWGSAFFFTTYQINAVSIEWSVFYRFFLTSLIFFLISIFYRKKISFLLKDHVVYFLLGVLLFSLHFIAVYYSINIIKSGLTAVGFSSILIMNVILSKVFLKNKFEIPVIIGSLCGILGIIFIFLPELSNIKNSSLVIFGFILSFFAAIIASFGNTLSEWYQKNGGEIIQTSAWGMSYGCIISALIGIIRGHSISFEFSADFIYSLLYLVIFCTTIAFWAYLSLIKKIGSRKAAYAWVAAPLVALFLSFLFENYQWTVLSIIGSMFLIFGNILILKK
ncbi:MAG: hypothetical protein CFH01_01100 [Alphaproteobacteria bacterium MarineAlpha2_Bin1]|nr:MAG: hypothetical protein CFH01_01100 [Alphaproteobacteria bacterium MarineAlpha2_Bin1]